MNSVTLSETAIKRIKEITIKPENHDKFFRISISGGGCSGFQYIFELDNKRLEGDTVSLCGTVKRSGNKRQGDRGKKAPEV